jgi:hypothetical protein
MSSRSTSRPGPGDSDVEIEVVQQPRPSKPRRAVNPEIDEVIHSGEISVPPRSMVIRSSASIPKIELADPDEEKTEMTRVPSMIRPPAPRGRSPLVWLLVVLVPALAGGAAFLIMSGRKAPAAAPAVTATAPAGQTIDLQVSAQAIGTALDGGMKAALQRAEAIAMSPTLRNGIMTDAVTVQDQANTGDTTYNLKPGEIVEVWRVAGGARTLWLRLPPDAAGLSAPAAGKTTVAVRGGEAFAIANAAITDQKGKVAGELAFGTPIDLASAKKRLPAQVAQARLVGLGPLLVLVDGGKGAKQMSVPVDTESKLPIALEASIR